MSSSYSMHSVHNNCFVIVFAPLIRLRHMALYKSVLIDWLIDCLCYFYNYYYYLMHWINGVLGRSSIYAGISMCLIVKCDKQLNSQKRCLMLFVHLARMDESADARRSLTAVPRSNWKRPAGRPHTSWLATMKNDLSYHNLSVEAGTGGYWQQAELCTEVVQAKQWQLLLIPPVHYQYYIWCLLSYSVLGWSTKSSSFFGIVGASYFTLVHARKQLIHVDISRWT